jgi:hypothetical protein
MTETERHLIKSVTVTLADGRQLDYYGTGYLTLQHNNTPGRLGLADRWRELDVHLKLREEI